MVGVLAGVPLHSTVVAALRGAAATRVPDPVDTHTLLVEIMRADMTGDWSRICLHAGDIEAIADKLVIDPVTVGVWHWENIQLTDRCAMALDIAWRLAHRYGLWPVPAGLVVLGLVADDSAAAARALRDGMSRPQLLELVQSDVLGTTLSGIDHTLATVLGESGTAQRARRHPRGSRPVAAGRASSRRTAGAGNWPVAGPPSGQGDWRIGTNRGAAAFVAATCCVVLALVGAAMLLGDPDESTPTRTTSTPRTIVWQPPTFTVPTLPPMPSLSWTVRPRPPGGSDR